MDKIGIYVYESVLNSLEAELFTNLVEFSSTTTVVVLDEGNKFLILSIVVSLSLYVLYCHTKTTKTMIVTMKYCITILLFSYEFDFSFLLNFQYVTRNMSSTPCNRCNVVGTIKSFCNLAKTF